MSMKLTNSIYVIYIFSLIATISALYLDYYVGIIPCILCVYQRYIYYILISVLTLQIYCKKRNFSYLIYLIIFSSLAISIYHSGVELQLWNATQGCKGNINMSNINSASELKNMLNAQEFASCDKAGYKILGFTLTNLNIFASLFMLIILYYGNRKRRK